MDVFPSSVGRRTPSHRRRRPESESPDAHTFLGLNFRVMGKRKRSSGAGAKAGGGKKKGNGGKGKKGGGGKGKQGKGGGGGGKVGKKSTGKRKDEDVDDDGEEDGSLSFEELSSMSSSGVPADLDESDGEDEAELEAFLFGGSVLQVKDMDESGGGGGGKWADFEEEDEDEDEDAFGESMSGSGSESGSGESGGRARKRQKRRAAAWVDPDDEAVEVNLRKTSALQRLRERADEKIISGTEYVRRLRKEYADRAMANARQSLAAKGTQAFEVAMDGDGNFVPTWARLPDELASEGSSGGALTQSLDALVGASEARALQHSAQYLAARGSGQGKLDADLLQYSQLRPLMRGREGRGRKAGGKKAGRGAAEITQIMFHPSGKIALIAGMNRVLRLVEVDGTVNTVLQQVRMKKMSVTSGSFLGDGSTVVFSGARKSFFTYDVASGETLKGSVPLAARRHGEKLGKFRVAPDGSVIAFLGAEGNIMLLSGETYEWLGNVKMHGDVRDVAFTPDSSKLVSVGQGSKVYIWSLVTRKIVHVFRDSGALNNVAVDVSACGRLLAIGSESGIVNLYEMNNALLENKSPKPLKSISNLTTATNLIRFHPSSLILAIGSSTARRGVRLVHIPSLTVFSNFPHSNDQSINKPTAISFSPGGAYMAIGTMKGDAHLWRLNYFTKA